MKGLLFTYVLTYGGALASLVDPFIGLLIYICFAIIKPEAMWHWAVPPGNYSRIVAFALLIGWGLRGFGSWQFGRGKGIVSLLLAFTAWITLNASLAPNQAVSWRFVEGLAQILLPFF